MEIQEVREMFERFATAFVNLSETAHRVDGLVQEVNNLRDELESVKRDRDNAYHRAHEVENHNRQLQGNVESLTTERDREKQHSEYLASLLVSRDEKVVGLETTLQQRQQEINEKEQEVNLLKSDLERLQDNLNHIAEERDRYKDAFHKIQEQLRPLLGNVSPFPTLVEETGSQAKSSGSDPSGGSTTTNQEDQYRSATSW